MLPIASPSTRIRARENKINLRELSQTMQTDFVQPGDLDNNDQDNTSVSKAVYPARETLGEGHAEPMTRMAQLTADNLTQSQQIPAVTHHDAVNTAAIDHFREFLKQQQSVKVSSLALQIMALAKTLRQFPRFNASLTDDGESLWVKTEVNIGIAVDTPHGLMVPVIENADELGLSAITTVVAELATAARNRKLTPAQMLGAGMSISNLGVLGGRSFTPMINPPEVAILGIMKTKIEPIWDGEHFNPTPMCPLSLTYDHRVINGADAQRFLNHYIRLLGSPRRMLF